MIGKDGGIAEGDAHLTNYRENAKFFLDPFNPANFEVVWNSASTIYKSLGTIATSVPAAKVKAANVLAAMSEEYKDVRDLSQPTFKPDALMKLSAEAGAGQILTKAVLISFEPNKSALNPEYDTTIPATLEEIGKLAGRFGNAYIIIEGNTDASRKGIVPTDLVRQLSYDRADSVRKAIMDKYKFDPNKFKVVGNGWDNPLPGCTDPSNPMTTRRTGASRSRCSHSNPGHDRPATFTRLPDLRAGLRGGLTLLVRVAKLHVHAEVSYARAIELTALFIGVILAAWWAVTHGEPEKRMVQSLILPSPLEVLQAFKPLHMEQGLVRSALDSWLRVTAGFALATLVAVPLGVYMATFPSIAAFFRPLALAGAYVPIVVLIPLSMTWFGTDEAQKIGFLFIGCFVALLPLVIKDIGDVPSAFLDVAVTKGASQWQLVRHVLFPVALPISGTICAACTAWAGDGSSWRKSSSGLAMVWAA